MRWVIETSHMVQVPTHLVADSHEELRRRVQAIADTKKVRCDRPAIGQLSFRYELRRNGDVEVVHAFFIGRDGKRRRFMRLRAENGEYTSGAEDHTLSASMQ